MFILKKVHPKDLKTYLNEPMYTSIICQNILYCMIQEGGNRSYATTSQSRYIGDGYQMRWQRMYHIITKISGHSDAMA